MERAARIAAVPFFMIGLASCATFANARKPASNPSAAVKKADPRPAKTASSSAKKPTTEPLVEAFRCAMQVGQHLNSGIRIYSSLDGKENSILYGTEKMDLPPNPNDHQLYLGVSAVVAGLNGGKDLTFKHPRIEIQISVVHNADKHTPLEAVYSDRGSGALNVQGHCTQVSEIAY